MNQSSLKVLHYLTGNNNIDAVTTEELQKLVEENPYFSVNHFLLAKKLQAEESPEFLAQVQKSVLYFPNPHWLHYQLLNESFFDAGFEDNSNGIQETAVNNVASSDINKTGIEEEHIEVNNSAPTVTEAEERTDKEKEDSSEHPITTVFSAEEIDAASNLAHETLQENGKVEINDPIADHLPAPTFSTGSDKHENTDQPEEEASVIARDTDEKTDQTLEEVEITEEPVIKDNFDQVVLDSLTPVEKEEVIEVSEEMAGVIQTDDVTIETFLSEAESTTNNDNEANDSSTEIKEDGSKNEPLNSLQNSPKESLELNEELTKNTGTPVNAETKEETPEPDEHEKMFLNIKAMLDASSEEANADVKNAVVPIDPYYTIDYFASQGIKLDLEQNPKDQLGKNLKKFTQWLKHMKKLGPEDATEVIIKNETEADIVRIADSSNTAREVVTEAMASVLEKQGKKDKAIELYNKLSFLNPDKSAYFAHKIKNLKGF